MSYFVHNDIHASDSSSTLQMVTDIQDSLASTEVDLINAAGQYWTERHSYLHSKGYILRPKFECEKTVLWKEDRLDAAKVRYLDFCNYHVDIQVSPSTPMFSSHSH